MVKFRDNIGISTIIYTLVILKLLNFILSDGSSPQSKFIERYLQVNETFNGTCTLLGVPPEKVLIII